jgi:hypothetical protein
MPTKPMTPAITAEEARDLAAEFHARTPPIQPYLNFIHGVIRVAATQGETSIEDPFADFIYPPPTQVGMEVIAAVLMSEGYGVAWREKMPPVLVISWEE